MSLLKQHTTKKGQVDKNKTKLAELNVSNNSDKYKLKTIFDIAIYIKKSTNYLPKLYYLIFQKNYLKKKNIWKPVLAVQHLQKLIILFYKNYLDKPIAISKAIDIILPITRPIIKLAAKQKV